VLVVCVEWRLRPPCLVVFTDLGVDSSCSKLLRPVAVPMCVLLIPVAVMMLGATVWRIGSVGCDVGHVSRLGNEVRVPASYLPWHCLWDAHAPCLHKSLLLCQG
jgi:hypothetical protein